MRRKLLLVLAVILATSCSGAFRYRDPASFDLPSWNRFRGNPQNTAYVASHVPLPNQLLWKHDVDKPLMSSPIITGRILIVGSLTKRVHFFDALTGKHLGVHKIPSAVSSSACGDGSVIYFGQDQGKETMTALNLQTGKVLWKDQLGDITSSPVLCGNRVVVGSGSGTLWALDRETGETVWQFKTSASIISTPACEDLSSTDGSQETIWFGSTDGRLYALESDSGKTIWDFDAKAGIYSSPAVKNGKVFFGSVDGKLYALDQRDGSLKWTFRTEGDIYSSPAAADSLVYIGSNDYCMYAVRQESGEMVWKFKTGGLIHSSPIAIGDKLFFGSYDGNFYVLDRFTGKLLWKYQTEGMISASPAYFDGKVYMASEDGSLYCFGP